MKKIFLLLIFSFITVVSFSQTYSQGEKVMINWKGQWFPGKIEAVKADKYLVSYDGYDASWNETVGTDRLKKVASGNSNVANTTTQNNNTANTTANVANPFYKSVETIDDISLSNDGKFIFAASGSGNVKILNANDLTLITRVEGKDPLQTSSISRDGKFLATGGTTFKIYMRNDAGNYDLYFTGDTYDNISKLCFSPITNELAVGAAPKEDYKKTRVDIWNVETKTLKQNFIQSTNKDYNISALTWSADGKSLAVGISNAKHGIDVFDATTGKLSYHITHETDVTAVAFSPDGKSIVSGGIDKKITLWNLTTKKATWTAVWKTGDQEYVNGVAFSPDGQTIAVCGIGVGSSVKIFNANDGSLKTEFGKSNPVGNAVVFNKEGTAVYVAFTTYGDIAEVPVVQKFDLAR